jgi:hypothetical protein
MALAARVGLSGPSVLPQLSFFLSSQSFPNIEAKHFDLHLGAAKVAPTVSLSRIENE